MALSAGICGQATHIPAGVFSITGVKCRSPSLRITCAGQSKQDAVQSTLRALKSQNHRPKKWLGQDDSAVQSYEKAIATNNSGAFKWEIVPIEILRGRGKPSVLVEMDAGVAKLATISNIEQACAAS